MNYKEEETRSGPYSDKSDETIEYLTSIVSDLVCRDIAFTYYPPLVF